MGIIKRLYIYTVSSISLLVLAIGLVNLVAVALGEIIDALGATVIGGGSTGREQLSLAIALVVVGAPVFGIHWWLVGRGWRGTDEAAREDRHSAVRAFHMVLVASVALGIAMYAALRLLDRGLGAALGVTDDGGLVADEVGLLLISVPVWWFHASTRDRDLRHDRLSGVAAWLTRLHRYLWAFIGLMFLLIGSSRVIDTVASALIGRSDFGSSQDWWRGPLAWSLAAIVTGLGVWWLHVVDARRAIRDATAIGEDDRSTALRMAYFGAVLLVALASSGLAIASSITEVGRQLLGVADRSDGGSILETVVGPMLVAVPFAVAGWLHWLALRDEAADRGDARRAVAVRLGLHLAALVGIAFLTVGVARLGGLLLEQAVGSVGADDFFRGELVWCLAQIVVGAVSWLPAWSTILRRRTAAPARERLATTARAYLLLVVGGALISGVPSAVFALFRLIDTLLGGGAIALGSDLSIPLAVVVVAAVVASYHGRLVVSDQRLASAQAAEATPETRAETAQAVEATPKTQGKSTVATPTAAGQPTVPSLPTTLALVLRGPGDEDLEAVLVSLRDHLPPGVVLEGG